MRNYNLHQRPNRQRVLLVVDRAKEITTNKVKTCMTCLCVYLQRSKYQLPGCAQHGSMAVGQVQQGPHALDVLGRQLTEGQTFRMETWTRK